MIHHLQHSLAGQGFDVDECVCYASHCLHGPIRRNQLPLAVARMPVPLPRRVVCVEDGPPSVSMSRDEALEEVAYLRSELKGWIRALEDEPYPDQSCHYP